MLWFTFKVTFGTIPAGWLGGKEQIIRLAKSSWSWSWDLSLATTKLDDSDHHLQGNTLASCNMILFLGWFRKKSPLI